MPLTATAAVPTGPDLHRSDPMTYTTTTAPVVDVDDQEHELFPELLADHPAGLTAAVEELAADIRARVESWSGGTR